MTCADCGNASLTLTTAATVYPHRRDLADKPIWRCVCGAFVGCHPGTTRALGTAAGPVLRKKRGLAHAMFDPIWREKLMTRGDAYAWLGQELGITDPTQVHIGLFNASDCHRTVNAAARYRSQAKSR